MSSQSSRQQLKAIMDGLAYRIIASTVIALNTEKQYRDGAAEAATRAALKSIDENNGEPDTDTIAATMGAVLDSYEIIEVRA